MSRVKGSIERRLRGHVQEYRRLKSAAWFTRLDAADFQSAGMAMLDASVRTLHALRLDRRLKPEVWLTMLDASVRTLRALRLDRRLRPLVCS